MIVENLEEYKKEAKKKKTVILDSLEESFCVLTGAKFIPEYIICDPQHKALFELEIKYSASTDGTLGAHSNIDEIYFGGYPMKILTRIEKGERAFKGIEMYGRINKGSVIVK